MTYIMLDVTTNTVVGPFDTEDAAVMFQMHAAEEINDKTQQLDIYECTDPTQWMLDNFTVYVPEGEWVTKEPSEWAASVPNTNIAAATELA